MQSESTRLPIDDLLQDCEEVKTTVIDFGEAKIQRSTKGDLCILTVSGIYSRMLGKELERICLACSTNLGLEFTEIKVNPSFQKKFDTSVVGVLRNIRDKFQTRKKHLLLCMPPSELIDLLKLTGVYEGYQVVEKPSSAVLARDFDDDREPDAPAKAAAGTAPHGQEHVGRRILELNHSLKRTASLEKGLESAEKCVKHFLPKAPPVVEGYSFAFSYKSSEKVGGDFFDFIQLPDNKLGLLIGDVSGHGLDAAILMGITKKVINLRASDRQFVSPRDVLVQANTDLSTDFNKYNFVTVLYATLKIDTGLLTLARAGHEMPVLFGAGFTPTVIESRGIPVGPASAKTFSTALDEVSVQIPRGAYFLLFTDGLSECWSPRGEAFGRARLLFSLSQFRSNLPCQQTLDRVLQTLADFAGDRAQEDDMTAILLHRT